MWLRYARVGVMCLTIVGVRCPLHADWGRFVWFAAYEEDTLVLVLKHGVGVLGVLGRYVQLFFLESNE